MSIKRVLSLLTAALLLCVGLCGCGNAKSSVEDTSSVNNVESVQTDENIYSVDAMLYEGTNIVLSCQNIMKDGIEFQVENLSEADVLVTLDVSLDGIGVNLWNDADEWSVGANKTKTCKMNGDIVYLEHATMSLHGIVFKDGQGIEEFDVCEADLGGSENFESEFIDGEKLYSSEELNVHYLNANAQGLNFLIKNNRESSITIGFETLTINNENKDYSGNVITVPPYTEQIFNLDILSYNSDYFPDNVIAFDGIMFTTISGMGKVDRFPVSFGDSVSAESSDNELNQIVDALSRKLPNTKCAHAGCTNYIAPSGTSNYCTEHSSHCIECNALIDEDTTYCQSCIAKKAKESTSEKHTCEECGKDASYTITGITGQTEYYCYTHYKEMKGMYDNLFGND